MVGTKIVRSRNGRHKNNSPKGWMGGELLCRHENNSPKAGELNGRHENNGDERVESYMVDIKITRQRMEN